MALDWGLIFKRSESHRNEEADLPARPAQHEAAPLPAGITDIRWCAAWARKRLLSLFSVHQHIPAVYAANPKGHRP